jgi:uncharacterized protein involved in exopolysaccharide biosynthesis
MQELNLSLIDNTPRLPAPPTPRDWAATGFRRGRILIVTFFTIFGTVAAITWMMPKQYEAQTKILVKHERQDPVVSPTSNSDPITPPDLTETELNSEVELIKSHDLLENVVRTMGLQNQHAASWLDSILEPFGGPQASTSDQARVLRAVRNLESSFSVEPLKKTRLIKVTYRSGDPNLSAAVLQTLVKFYLEKHLEVHRAPGVLDFFQAQADQYRRGLNQAEEKLAQFGNTGGVVAAPLQKELTVRKMDEFESNMRQTRAAIAETEGRIRVLEDQEATTPSRLTTQVKTSGNPMLIEQMTARLRDLELQRTKLLTNYTETYRPVQELEAQITQAKDALTKAEDDPIREETTDRDSTHDWIRGELAKARAELIALQARVGATNEFVGAYKNQARQLNQTEIVQQDLVRDAKTAEDNYLLYSRKQEEARISEALDKQRIVNVAVAEEPTPPALPASPNWMLNLALGGLLALFTSIAIAMTTDHLDRSFRTPDDVEVALNIPVLAYLPKN